MQIASKALKAMLIEAVTTPKPGLVDMSDSGSHNDMDIYTFIDSSMALFPYMYDFAAIGWNFKGEDLRKLFQAIRKPGMDAEGAMMKATNSVNTQKGLIFALGCICAASGYLLGSGMPLTVENVTGTVAGMTKGICREELEALLQNSEPGKKLTYGEKLYLKYGVKGIRGEAETGFINAAKYGLPELKKSERLSHETAVNALLSLMENVTDTNVLHRGGPEGLELMKNSAKTARQLGGIKTEKGKKFLAHMNKEFIDANISPGGCADMLAISVMLYLLCEKQK